MPLQGLARHQLRFEGASQAAEKVGVALDFGWRSGLPLRFELSNVCGFSR
jgi:hypothetical protein